MRGARSGLYRSQMSQVNIRWKALAEIYTMHSFAQLYNLIFFDKLAKLLLKLAKFLKIFNFEFANFSKILM